MVDIPEFIIRPAVRNDTSLILKYIKRLAEYENKLDLVTATEEDIEKYIFDIGIIQAIIGEYLGKPVGFAVFFHNFSTFLGKPGIYIEDLFIDKEMRNRGFGISMLSYIASLAVKNGYQFLEWSVLKWNKPSIELYRKIGAERKDEWDLYRLSGNPLKRLADNSNN